MPNPRIALVGERSPHVLAHTNIPTRLDAAATAVEAYWIATDTIDPDELALFDGIWLVPGSPYASESGALAACRIAREQRIPFLATCGGIQHALLEFARNVADQPNACHAENDPAANDPLIVLLACSLAGHQAVVEFQPDSRIAHVMGSANSIERFNCSYGLAPDKQPLLEQHGLRFTGHDDTGAPRVIELDDHPFFVGTLFQPELWGRDGEVHPLIAAYLQAVTDRADKSTTAPAAL